MVSALHLGKQLCGHAGIIHGGMIATLLDEILGCVVSVIQFPIPNFGSEIAVIIM